MVRSKTAITNDAIQNKSIHFQERENDLRLLCMHHESSLQINTNICKQSQTMARHQQKRIWYQHYPPHPKKIVVQISQQTHTATKQLTDEIHDFFCNDQLTLATSLLHAFGSGNKMETYKTQENFLV